MLLLKKGQLNEGANILNLSPCTRVLFNAIKDNWLIQTSVWFFQYVQSKLDMYGLNYKNEKKTVQTWTSNNNNTFLCRI